MFMIFGTIADAFGATCGTHGEYYHRFAGIWRVLGPSDREMLG
jgi:hypothetical protein